jgi:transcriptional regulator with PAS, ATPase and Fis domain
MFDGISTQDNMIVGQSEKMKKIFQLIDIVAKTEATVLVEGETGTGKELIANVIHQKSPRYANPFCRVNCAALSENLLESEFFGHKKGAFTGAQETKKGFFELANNGSLLLDEIGNLSLFGQAKLLRALQEYEVLPVGETTPVKIDIRVIVTTNIFLGDAVKKGEFREDLYYRLKVFSITLPPLREIKEDIPLLANHFLKDYAVQYQKKVRNFSKEAMHCLMEHDWPGNVRELKNTIRQGVIMEDSDTIQVYHLPAEICSPTSKVPAKDEESLNLKQRLNLLERRLIVKALNQSHWKKKAACNLLGIDQRNLSYFLKKHHITDPISRLNRRAPST